MMGLSEKLVYFNKGLLDIKYSVKLLFGKVDLGLALEMGIKMGARKKEGKKKIYIYVLNHSLDGPWPSPTTSFSIATSENLNSSAAKSFIPRNTVKLSTHYRKWSGPYHLRVYLIRELFQTLCLFFGDHTFHFWVSI